MQGAKKKWTERPLPHAVSAALILGFVAFLVWAVLRPESTTVYAPSATGEVTIVRVLGARGATRDGDLGWTDLMVTVPSGKELPTRLRELLPVGEHLWAVYSVSTSHQMVQLHAYVRCGPNACPAGMKP